MDRVGHIVRHRAVFFVPTFDPELPRALRERYRREAAKQAHLTLRATNGIWLKITQR